MCDYTCMHAHMPKGYHLVNNLSEVNIHCGEGELLYVDRCGIVEINLTGVMIAVIEHHNLHHT